MTKVNVFYKEESPYHPGKYLIKADLDKFHLVSTTGSFNVIQARLFGLTYATYLRMCRDCFGAEIIGKNSTYPVAYFKQSNELNALIKALNTRANFILWEREHPDFKEHADFVKQKNPEFYREVVGDGFNL